MMYRMLVPSVRAATAEAQLMQAGLERIVRDTTPGLYLTADWEFDLPDGLVDSLRRGIALYFLYEFRLEKPRWYWMDKTVTSSQLVQRIGYSPLSRQYRFSRGGLTQSFGTLEEVLPLLKHIGDWRVADANAVDDTDKFIAETKMSLDVSRLPKPLQVSIGGNSDWAVESSWEEIPLTAALTRR